MRLSAIVLALALAAPALAPLSAVAASKATARATGDLPIRSGPGTGYQIIGTLKDGARVHLEKCTRSQNWCLFVDKSGNEVGWVRGSYLVGSGAKLEVTPSRLFDDDWGLFGSPLFGHRDHGKPDGFDD